MPKATLIYEGDFKRIYRISDSRTITLVYDDYDDSKSRTITFEENGQRIGDEFKFIDESADGNEDGVGNGNRFLLQRMFTPVTKAGLGRLAIKFFIEITNATIYTRKNDGIERSDGSNLTGDAPGFVSKMQDEGLIERWSE